MSPSNTEDLRIALLQCDLSWENTEDNIRQIGTFMSQSDITRGNWDLLLLPEMWATGFTMEPESKGLLWKPDFAHSSQDWPPPLQAMLDWSLLHNAAVVGSLACYLSDEKKSVNRCFFMTPQGILGWYDKRQLFSFAGEDATYQSGNNKVVIPWRGWNIQLQICYDLRFPETCRNQAMNPCDLLLFVANWPEVRSSAWEVLLPARAIENQAYVAGVNRIGQDVKGNNHNGLSAVYDSQGNSISESGPNTNGWIFAVLNKTALQQYRGRFPVLEDIV
jgi:predicted amidohydrolase